MYNFNSWLKEFFPPCGIVYSSANARKALKEDVCAYINNFSEKNPKLNVLFYNASDYRKVSDFEATLREKILSATDVTPHWDIFNFHITKDSLETIQNEYHKFNSFKWFNFYEKTFFELMRFSEYEMLQQPVIVIFFVDIDEDDTTIVDKIKFEQSPPLFSEGIFIDDVSRIPKLIILTKDKESKVSDAEKEKIINDFKEKYYKFDVICLDIDDSSGSSATFNNYIEEVVLVRLNRTIDEIKNELKEKKSFFSIFKKEKNEVAKYFNVFKLHPAEHKVYLLGILQFFLMLYEDAYETFSSLQSEIKKISVRHENNLNLMISICRFMRKTINKKKSKKEFLTVYPNYVKSLDYKGAARAIFVEIRMREHLKQKKAIIELDFPKNVFNFILLKPILEEKRNFFYIKNYFSPSLRKFMLSTMITSNNYFEAGTSIVSVNYTINSFGYLYKMLSQEKYNYESYALSKLYYSQKMVELCLKIKYDDATKIFCVKCLDLVKDLNQRAHYFNLLLSVCNSDSKVFSFNGNIPLILSDSIEIIDSSDRAILKKKTYLNFTQTLMKYKERNTHIKYTPLSEKDIFELQNIDRLINESGAYSWKKRKKNFRCKVKEEMYLRFKIYNPLKIKISISSLTAMCDDEDVNFEMKFFDLGPKEKKEVELKATKKSEGDYCVKGIKFKLGKKISVEKPFRSFVQENQYLLYKYIGDERFLSMRTNWDCNNNFKVKVVDEKKDILISFPKGKEVEIYENTLFMLPIVVNNKLSKLIKKVTVYVIEEGEKIFLCDFVYRDISFESDNLIHLPVIGKIVGVVNVGLCFKFEEDYLREDSPELFRFGVTFSVLPSFALNYEITPYSVSEKGVTFLLSVIYYLKNKKKFSNLALDSSLAYDKSKVVVQPNQDIESFQFNSNSDSCTKYYKTFLVANSVPQEKPEELDFSWVNYPEDASEIDRNETNDLLKKKISSEKNLILKYTMENSSNEDKETKKGIYFVPLRLPELKSIENKEKIYRKILYKSISYSYRVVSLTAENILLIIDFKIDDTKSLLKIFSDLSIMQVEEERTSSEKERDFSWRENSPCVGKRSFEITEESFETTFSLLAKKPTSKSIEINSIYLSSTRSSFFMNYPVTLKGFEEK